MELSRLIQHPEEMNRETLYDLRALLALYPYYQTARLLMLQNLYILHDPSFDEELRRTAIYITDRKVIFQMIEAAHYKLKQSTTAHKPQLALGGKAKEDRTNSLIDDFLHSIPAENEEEDEAGKGQKRKPTPADAAVDYVAYLMETETEEKSLAEEAEKEEREDQQSRTISLIDDFMEEGGFNINKINGTEPPATQEPKATEESEPADNGGVFTETLARIYIKQGKYERAYQIIDRLHKGHPHKSAYYIDQLRFLEKLILNSKQGQS